MTDEVLVETRDNVLVMTINRPDARNAINRGVSLGIAEGVDRLDQEPGLSVGILTGAGGTFSSGMDLKGFLRGENPSLEGRGLGGIIESSPRKPPIGLIETNLSTNFVEF